MARKSNPLLHFWAINDASVQFMSAPRFRGNHEKPARDQESAASRFDHLGVALFNPSSAEGTSLNLAAAIMTAVTATRGVQ